MVCWNSIRRKPHVFKIYFHILELFYAIFTESSHGTGITLIVGLNSLLKISIRFQQNGSLKCKGCLQEISFRAKWNIFNSLYGQSLIAAYLKYPEMKLIAGYFDRNGSSICKWNPPKRIYICKFFKKLKTVHRKIKTKIVSFHFSRNEN